MATRSGRAPAAPSPSGWDRPEGPLRLSEIGSPFPFGRGPYFTDEGHQEHIHIGYSYMPG